MEGIDGGVAARTEGDPRIGVDESEVVSRAGLAAGTEGIVGRTERVLIVEPKERPSVGKSRGGPPRAPSGEASGTPKREALGLLGCCARVVR
jgi:hypothetical protein